jgi:hypothetical protein
MMTPTTKVPPERHSTAQSFSASLDLPAWADEAAWDCHWVFRGQRNAEWDLTPAAWRTQDTIALKRLGQIRDRYSMEYGSRIEESLHRDPLKRHANAGYVIKAYAQGRAEFSLLIDFLRLADELGHRVPGMDNYTRLSHHDYLPDVQSYPLVRFMPDLGPASALAQHHGVPTRSLDWTRNPMYAAYFAASEVDSRQTDGTIAVWAIRPDLLLELGRADAFNSEYTRFLHHTVPNGDNPYLRSQEGLFVHPTYGCAHVARTGEFPNLESFALRAQELSSVPVIRKLTLPYSEVGDLLRLLWLRGISRAHLMPTLDNVTHALCSRWTWAPR